MPENNINERVKELIGIVAQRKSIENEYSQKKAEFNKENEWLSNALLTIKEAEDRTRLEVLTLMKELEFDSVKIEDGAVRVTSTQKIRVEDVEKISEWFNSNKEKIKQVGILNPDVFISSVFKKKEIVDVSEADLLLIKELGTRINDCFSELPDGFNVSETEFITVTPQIEESVS